jgi:carbonic anhydrase
VTQSLPTAADALTELMAGNRRFIDNSREHPNQDAHRRSQLAQGQRPWALIFGCADSRVAAEIIFDRGLGDLFVVRTAGHVVDGGVLGSIEFGVEVLEIPLIVVLGHDGCGAVSATLDAFNSGEMPPGYLRNVVELVTPSVISAHRKGNHSIEAIVAEHTRNTADLLTTKSAIIARRTGNGSCAVVAMEYALSDGEVRILGTIPADLRSEPAGA